MENVFFFFPLVHFSLRVPEGDGSEDINMAESEAESIAESTAAADSTDADLNKDASKDVPNSKDYLNISLADETGCKRTREEEEIVAADSPDATDSPRRKKNKVNDA